MNRGAASLSKLVLASGQTADWWELAMDVLGAGSSSPG